VLSRPHPVVPDSVNCAPLGRRHQPGTGIARHAALRPFGERDQQRLLRQLFGPVDIADHAGEARDEPCPLDPEGRLDRPLNLVRRHAHALGEHGGGEQAAQRFSSLS
jgi:hypothetical protein